MGRSREREASGENQSHRTEKGQGLRELRRVLGLGEAQSCGGGALKRVEIDRVLRNKLFNDSLVQYFEQNGGHCAC